METRTLLRDFQSHNQSRSVYTVESGLVLKANKIRLVDFNIYSDSNYATLYPMNFHPFAGVYSLIKKVSLLNLQGQEIDSMTNCINNMSLRLLHMDNGSQAEVNSVLSLTRNAYNNPSETNISALSTTTKEKITNVEQGLYIDLASMLNYLNSREHLVEGFTLVIEWESDQTKWKTNTTTQLYISSPTLAIDEVLNMSMQQVEQKPVMFTNLVNDYINFQSGDLNKITRLNSFYNQFISNLYYLNNIVSSGAPYNNLGFSSDLGETFELTIDGRKLLPLKGIDTPARKLALWNDFTGDGTMLIGSNQLLKVNLNVELQDINGLKIPLANKMSYGCIKLDRFIQNDLTLSYVRKDLSVPPDPDSGSPAIVNDVFNLSVVAEVLKMYDPKSGQLTYVKQ